MIHNFAMRSALIIAMDVASVPKSLVAQGATAGRADSAAPRIEVSVDRRMELLSIIFRLAGGQEFTSSFPAYSAAIDSFFAPHRNHRIVAEARRLQRERGICCDAVMSLAAHLGDFPALEVRTPLEGSMLESRWQPDEARAFAALVRDFARESHAAEFFTAQKPLYDLTTARMAALVETDVDQAWFPAFFGPLENSRFRLVVALNNGNNAYGVQVRPHDAPRELYAVMNATNRDAEGMPAFSRNFVPTIVHEFGHSFVNPTVDAQFQDVRAAAHTVHAAVAPAMRAQGYGLPQTMVSESIVRASVARYVLDHEGEDGARTELSYQRARNFLWIDDLHALLGDYARSRDRYPTIESFWPTIAKYYNDLAPRIGTVLAVAERRRPTIVSSSLKNGSTNVNPRLTYISFTFDRPMRGSYSLMLSPTAGRDHYPVTTAVTWDSTRRVLTMTVQLKPDWTYEFGLNAPDASRFVSEEGYALTPVVFRFVTSPAWKPPRSP
jgi:hypothetical protein